MIVLTKKPVSLSKKVVMGQYFEISCSNNGRFFKQLPQRRKMLQLTKNKSFAKQSL